MPAIQVCVAAATSSLEPANAITGQIRTSSKSAATRRFIGRPLGSVTVGVLLDHLVRPLQDRRRDRQAEGLGGLEVDHELELGGLFDWQVCGLGALENPVHVEGGARLELRRV